MRVHVLSDLHMEFGQIDVPDVDCDCVILAGDVATGEDGLRWILRRYPDVPVIYICGNHEFYGSEFPALIGRLRRQARGTNVHFLENEEVSLGGFHFFGCTLWSDMALHGSQLRGALFATAMMNDYKRIQSSTGTYSPLSARETCAQHASSLDAIRAFLARHDPDRCIVVTHHAPTVESLPKHRRALPVSCAYASHLDSFIRTLKPRLWIHGHIHTSSNYQLGRTRVIANPRGYPDQSNRSFQPDLTLVLEAGNPAPV
jgi:predicted phosphohydrolase